MRLQYCSQQSNIFLSCTWKIQKRLATLETMPWSEDKKVQIERAIGSLEYTSSDESDLSEGENGVQKLSGYLVKKIPWERSALTRVNRSLDDDALERLTPRARANFCQGEGILISQTGNGHLTVSPGQSGPHLPLHQHPINPSLQERQRPHYHQDQGQQRPHCHQPGQRLQFRP